MDPRPRYERAKLERFGTFRELTKVGFDKDGDGGLMFGWIAAVTDGCNANAYFGTSCSR